MEKLRGYNTIKIIKMQLTRKQENNISTADYHKIKDRLNSSGMRTFMDNRIAFMKEWVLGEPRKDKRSHWIDVGHMVHCLLLEGQEALDSRYTLSAVGTPIGQMLTLVDNLYDIAKRSMVEEEGNIIQKRQFEELWLDAVQMTKFNWDMEEVAFKGKDPKTILGMFTKPDKNGVTGESYYQELLRNTNKIVISENTIMTVEKIVEELKTHPATCDIANMQDEEGVRDVYRELVILFKYRDMDMKAALDQVEVNHIGKYIQPDDYKIQYDNEIMEYSYLKHKYWVPAAVYNEAATQWAKEHGYADYEIRPLRLIAADSTSQYSPIVYTLSAEDVERGYKGFKINNREYQGADAIIDEIRYHLETGNWKSSATAQKNGNVLPLSINYDN